MSATDEKATMTRREREDLARLARKHERLEKGRVDERKAELRADFERLMDTHYAWESDGRWTEAVKTAQAAVDAAEGEARVKIATRCDELGIPSEFRPSFHIYTHWESASAQRYGKGTAQVRDQKRRAVATKLDALAKKAKVEIERKSLEVQTRLIADGLTSEAAQRFLGELPTATALMAPLDPEEVKKLLPGARGEDDGQ